MPLSRPDVTIVVAPRERFSATRQTLDALQRQTAGPFRLVVVDGGAPRPVARYLRDAASRGGFTLVGDGRRLSPDAARNVAFAEVTTPYAVFLDNDVVVTPGWLDALLACAEDTG